MASSRWPSSTTVGAMVTMPDPIVVSKFIRAGVVRDVDAADAHSIENEVVDPLALGAVDEIIEGSVGIEAIAGDGAAVIQLGVVIGDAVNGIVDDG